MKPAILERIFKYFCRRDRNSQIVIVEENLQLGIYSYRIGELEGKEGFIALGVEDQSHPELQLATLAVWHEIPSKVDHKQSGLEIFMRRRPGVAPISLAMNLHGELAVGGPSNFVVKCLNILQYITLLFKITEGKG